MWYQLEGASLESGSAVESLDCLEHPEHVQLHVAFFGALRAMTVTIAQGGRCLGTFLDFRKPSQDSICSILKDALEAHVIAVDHKLAEKHPTRQNTALEHTISADSQDAKGERAQSES